MYLCAEQQVRVISKQGRVIGNLLSCIKKEYVIPFFVLWSLKGCAFMNLGTPKEVTEKSNEQENAENDTIFAGINQH